MKISAALSDSWVYQNTPATTQDRHKVLLSVTIDHGAKPGETYAVDLREYDNSAGPIPYGPLKSFVAQGTSDPLIVAILGARVGSGGSDFGNPKGLRVRVRGQTDGQCDWVDLQLQLRPLGDVDGSGIVTATDKLNFNKRLNGIATAYPDRCYDLTGDGLVNALDKLCMNRAMNGQAIP